MLQNPSPFHAALQRQDLFVKDLIWILKTDKGPNFSSFSCMVLDKKGNFSELQFSSTTFFVGGLQAMMYAKYTTC